jgi:hypothetical protein
MESYLIPATIRFQAATQEDADMLARHLSQDGKEARNWAQETVGSLGAEATDNPAIVDFRVEVSENAEDDSDSGHTPGH